MTKYLLTFHPFVEIVAVSPESGVSGSSTPLLVSSSSTWPQADLYHGASETDLISLVSTLSAEAFQAAKVWNRSISRAKTSTLLLLLSTSGAIIYLLYKRRSSDSARTPDARSRSSRKRRPRWRSRDWLWWLFGDDSDFCEEETVVLQSGKCIVTPPSILGGSFTLDRRFPKRLFDSHQANQTVVLTEAPNGSASFQLAPCPNCLLGICRIKKHESLRQHENAASTSSSSYSNSPMHVQDISLLPPTSTPESADDEASDWEDSSAKAYTARADKFRSRFFRPELDIRFKGDGSDGESPLLLQSSKTKVPKSKHNSTAKLYSAQRRIPPVGQELWSPVTGGVIPLPTCGDSNCPDSLCCPSTLPRDESMDSVISVSGSMMDLVKGAREIRRLIREASFDSIASEFSLDVNLNEEMGGSTEFYFDSLQQELAELKQNCNAMDDKFDRIPMSSGGPGSMVSSKSEYGLSTSPSSSYCCESRRSKTPDMLLLQRPRKNLWKITNYNASESDSPLHVGSYNGGEESLEWDSPMHGWHDLRKPKYKFALSSQSTSECGDEDKSFVTHDGLDPWEWDSEGLAATEDWGEMTPTSMMHHQKWLPEHAERFEMDLEAELLSSSQFGSKSGGGGSRGGSANSSRSGSRRESMDRSFFFNRVRLPPSGRSSVDRGSGDTPKQCIDHAALVKSFGVYPVMTRSTCSEESGFQDGCCGNGSLDVSSNSSTLFASSVLTLSPVHEAKEPSGSAPATPLKRADVDRCNKVLFRPNAAAADDEERLVIVVDHEST